MDASATPTADACRSQAVDEPTLVSLLLELGSACWGAQSASPSHAAPSPDCEVVTTLCTTPAQIIRRAATLGDAALLSTPPPMLLHDAPMPGANRLYGGTRAPRVSDAGYRCDAYAAPEDASPRRVLGAAFAQVGTRDAACGIYHQVLDGVPTLVCHMHDAPLAFLESALFDATRVPSLLEQRWFDGDAAANVHTLRVGIGAFARLSNLATLPSCLISGNYHLIRKGPLPFLHLRGASSDYEHEVVAKLCSAMLRPGDAMVTIDDVTTTDATEATATQMRWSASDSVFAPPRQLLTIFDRAPAHNAVTGGQASFSQTPCGPSGLLPTQCVLACVAHAILFADLITTDEASDAHRDIKAEVSRTTNQPTKTFSQASAMARLPPPPTFSRLLHTHPALHTLRRVVPRLHTEAERLALASEIFDCLDAILAVRGTERANGNAHEAVMILARRVKPPQAVLFVALEQETQWVQTALLVNSTYESPALGFDEAVRLASCPWVTTVGVDGDGACFLMSTHTQGSFDRLSIHDSVRAAYGLVPTMPTSPLATQEGVQALRQEFTSLRAQLASKRAFPFSATDEEGAPRKVEVLDARVVARLREIAARK